MAERQSAAGAKGYKRLCDVIVLVPMWTVMTVSATQAFAPTKRGAFSGLPRLLYLALTLLTCGRESES